MLKYLDKGLAKTIGVELKKDQNENDKALKEQASKFTANERKELEDIRKHLASEVSKYKTTLSIAFKDNSALGKFIEAFSSWMLASSLLPKSKVKFDINSVDSNLRDVIRFTESESKRIAGGHGVNAAITALLNGFIKHFLLPGDPVELSKLKSMVSEYSKDQLESSNKKGKDSADSEEESTSDVKDDLTTDATDTILSDTQVDSGINIAKKSTDKSNPSNEDIISEVNDYLQNRVLGTNIQHYTSILNKKIEKFNKLSSVDKTVIVKDHDYKLEKGDVLNAVTASDVKNLLKNFIQIVGEIVPYYFKKGDEEDRKYLSTVIMLYIFEIYAVKKDASGSISSVESAKIVKNIKEENPDQFK